MKRLFLLLALALALPTMSVMPTAAQEASDVTFDGEVTETAEQFAEGASAFGPGFIRITLTPSLDGVLRAEVLDVQARNLLFDLGVLVERVATRTKYFWPALPIQDGSFTLRMPLSILSLSDVVTIEGDVISGSELRGTLHSTLSPIATTWSATGPVDTPPGADDRPLEAYAEGGGRVSVSLTEDGQIVTAFHLQELPLDPCFPGETLSVRAFYKSGTDLQASAGFTNDSITRSVSLDVTEVEGSHASGTVSWRSGFFLEDCGFVVRWQTEPFPTATATLPATPTATQLPATPTLTPVEPTGLPPAGGGGASGVPSAGLAILVALAGAAFATAGLLRMRV